MKSATLVLLAPLLLAPRLFGCARRDAPAPVSPAAPAVKPTATPPRGSVARTGDVGTYVSTPSSFSTSSYWIEGDSGLVAIDTQLLPSAAEEMIERAETTTRKKLVLAIVLHANPDKFNGTSVFQRHGVRVVTSEQVRRLVPEMHEKGIRDFSERYAPDYPAELPRPDAFGAKTTDLMVAGVKLRLHVLGAARSESHVVVERPDTKDLFVGDLVASQNHAWIEIGKTDAWLSRLEELRRLDPRRIFPGRGPAGDATLLDDQETYLRAVISAVAAERPSLPLRTDALARAKKRVVDAYPTYGHALFLDAGLPAEWERQAKAR